MRRIRTATERCIEVIKLSVRACLRAFKAKRERDFKGFLREPPNFAMLELERSDEIGRAVEL